MAQYEIEIKSLLGEKTNADALIEKLTALDPDCARVAASAQLNHYFESGDMEKLYKKAAPLLADDAKRKLREIIDAGTSFSVRTRQKDDAVLLVVKASIDDGTSANSVSRLEFEEPVPASLDELDEALLDAGFEYQAKWSREREEYAFRGANVCLDKNAGYGYLVEFEKVVGTEEDAARARKELLALMDELGVAELPQDRLERMFAHYNQNWPEYYGTDKVFVIQ